MLIEAAQLQLNIPSSPPHPSKHPPAAHTHTAKKMQSKQSHCEESFYGP